MSRRIVLLAVNARYSHTAHGIRSLAANMGELRDITRLLEFDLHAAPEQIVARILDEPPDILGCSVYIWNVTLMEEVVRRLRRAGFAGHILCGGPEAGYLPASHALIEQVDYRVCGEGEVLFPELCRRILSGDPPEGKHHAAEPPDVTHITLPYAEYADADLAHRMLYVEASRGCPFQCDYCLSSLDAGVRFFPLDRLLPAFEALLERGARRFKFLDRCFNIRDEEALAILQFFLERKPEGMILHLEVIPDRISPALLEMVRAFPSGALHIEAGRQTYAPDVAERIRRRCAVDVADTNLRHLIQAGAVVHADLIVGL
ncbi:MAG: cobalamin-dependent protein, partial [Kiritimatiellae bacterium]|nr:cobalamin-dependent protein [Kiritimatiellia bacterium]